MNINIRTIENGSIMTTGLPRREKYFATDEELLTALREELKNARAKETQEKEEREERDTMFARPVQRGKGQTRNENDDEWI